MTTEVFVLVNRESGKYSNGNELLDIWREDLSEAMPFLSVVKLKNHIWKRDGFTKMVPRPYSRETTEVLDLISGNKVSINDFLKRII